MELIDLTPTSKDASRLMQMLSPDFKLTKEVAETWTKEDEQQLRIKRGFH